VNMGQKTLHGIERIVCLPAPPWSTILPIQNKQTAAEDWLYVAMAKYAECHKL